jgi:hypothetical protein
MGMSTSALKENNFKVLLIQLLYINHINNLYIVILGSDAIYIFLSSISREESEFMGYKI